jgi:predicted ATPase
VIVQLLERGASLAALAGYAREARQGDGRLVLVAGEAGIGKSALVEQLRSDLTDARWSWGACDGLFTPRPLGPLFDLADLLKSVTASPLLSRCLTAVSDADGVPTACRCDRLAIRRC